MALSPGGGQHQGASVLMLALLEHYDSGGGMTGAWHGFFANMAISKGDGTVLQLVGNVPPAFIPAPFGAQQQQGQSNLAGVAEAGPTTGASASATAAARWAATHFLFADHLGSAALELSSGGWPVSSTRFAPYGEELPGSTGTFSHYKFTGKERDTESGLDYFGARYFGSAVGRWMSPDYSANSVILELPQSWNKYSYILNRPIFASDPDGRCPCCVGAVVGGVIEGGVDAYNQLSAPGGSTATFNWGEFGAHVAGGAVSGALAVATGGASLVESAVVGDIAAGGVSNVVGGVVTRALDPTVESVDVLSSGAVSEDAVSGFVGGYAGHLAGDSIHLPDDPVKSGIVSARRRLPARTPDGRFASYDKLTRQQVTRAGVSGDMFTHLSNLFNDLFFPPPVTASPTNTRITVKIVSCNTQDGQPCQP